jgi:sigma-B regulation protein RsbU (phosphoserine phosphatase)
VLFDPATDCFEELTGEGIALGIDDSWQYVEGKRSMLTAGQIIVLSTDGIWEARNSQDEMFGKEAIYNIIRQNPHAGAAKVQDAVLTELKQFQQGVEPADDITLVIIKIEGNR